MDHEQVQDAFKDAETYREVEEDGRADLERRIAEDPEFARLWERMRPRRELATQVMRARAILGYSQEEVARRIGTSQARISQIERGEANPTLETIERLVEVLGIRLEVRFPEPHAEEPIRG